MTWSSPQPIGPDNSAILSDVSALAECIGSSQAPAAWSPELLSASISTVDALTGWIRQYRETVLASKEWPIVLEAWQFTRNGKSRDLIRLDQKCDSWMTVSPYKEASRKVGHRQLCRLRALRDQRIIFRYLDAIGAGQANGWHPVVYGLYLAVFNLPLRQGLVNFGEQTIRGLVRGVPRGPLLTDENVDETVNHEVGLLPGALPELPGGQLFSQL